MPYARLDDRATLHLSGAETEEFLQGLVTADVAAVTGDAASPAALLTPQGKVMFEFLLSRIEGGMRLDGPAGLRADLKKRLTLYRLRLKIAIEESDEAVFAVWDEVDGGGDGALSDRRFSNEPVYRAYGAPPAGAAEAAAEDYRKLRITFGVAELGADYPPSEVFPHDVLMDYNAGVSFKKGCFVGQEVVSRMQHRGTARRRLMLVTGEAPLIAGSEIRAGERSVGEILSIEDAAGLAMVRIDRLAQAAASGAGLSVEGVPVALSIPPYAGYAIPAAGDAADAAGGPA
ncbi:YgfZ/GcvT domain-containing protein [Jiella mangrovi]|uniref:Folate-binding protein YgfZ n=1 Tax=Jiella mangrovi TaxID=2821407 RepID=A0ABS4BL93_9HYPH|nr:folate-binding protein YgfZ [Jiella mangrovi]MBP0617287.1 folate-binding protein YgfZ [Jiella mangrovi]